MESVDEVKKHLLDRINVGAAQASKAIEAVLKMVIQDYLVAPTAMHFSSQGDRLLLYYPNGNQVKIHPHAIGQLLARAELPQGLLTSCTREGAWAINTLACILDDFYKNKKFAFKESERHVFLHRIVDEELRGFMSRRFNVHFATAGMVRTFASAAIRNGCTPAEAVTTDVRFALKALLPTPVRAGKEFLAFGVEFSNSDFGVGKTKISMFFYRTNSKSYITCDEGMSRVHLGRILEDSDIEVNTEAARKEAEAINSAIDSTVDSLMNAEAISKMVDLIDQAAEAHISWHTTKKKLSALLSKGELAAMEGMVALPRPDLPTIEKGASVEDTDVTKWWVSSVLSTLAEQEKEPDRKLELQRMAGSWVV